MITLCKYCGENINGKPKYKIGMYPYCSKHCSLEDTNNYKNCLVCGKKFPPKNKNQIYCSALCQSKKIKKEYKNKVRLNDFLIFERDGFKCTYCGKTSYEDGVKLHIEHVYPISKGGNNKLFNITTSCQNCNSEKHNKIMDENNLLNIWAEISKRNEKSGIEHYKGLIEKLDGSLKNRVNKR